MLDERRLPNTRLAAMLGAGDERAASDQYPCLQRISVGMHTFDPSIGAAPPPEYVTVPMPADPRNNPRLALAVEGWNGCWEFRQLGWATACTGHGIPSRLEKALGSNNANALLVLRTRSRYPEYLALFHLLSRSTVERYGLPLLSRGHWPYRMDWFPGEPQLPLDFENRLSRAWASTVWRHLVPGSPISGFTASDPIRLLAHNLDFWIPPVGATIQQTLREKLPVDTAVMDMWRGEREAADMVRRTVDQADKNEQLRGILDAVRSNRAEDDFSDRWTYAREDFERKLYRKRSQIKVRFVELTDIIPVQGPETEIVDRMVYGDFLALLNEKDREVVVLVYSGITNLTEIAEIMGYRNHSAVSKRLNRIRVQASRFFDA
ncbi:sigma-70 family RNA polymerase sigma factor [Nocardia sp. NPDC046473]|uniref:sigma-70 family RNA polymerase sigma factor n=1 Tax=Nocardia sp. NPDC046473 TaxID=3155733 RepID=UPI0033EF6E37